MMSNVSSPCHGGPCGPTEASVGLSSTDTLLSPGTPESQHSTCQNVQHPLPSSQRPAPIPTLSSLAPSIAIFQHRHREEDGAAGHGDLVAVATELQPARSRLQAWCQSRWTYGGVQRGALQGSPLLWPLGCCHHGWIEDSPKLFWIPFAFPSHRAQPGSAVHSPCPSPAPGWQCPPACLCLQPCVPLQGQIHCSVSLFIFSKTELLTALAASPSCP